MNILITGAAGVIGSALTEKFHSMGMNVTCVDICRINEAWRLNNVRDQIKYLWKASNDLLLDDIRDADVIIDAGLGVADRPFGNSSPSYTVWANTNSSLRILDLVGRMDSHKPTIIYPSSFNTLYGYPNGSKYNSHMLPNPSSLYGWTKASIELLYTTYRKSHNVPCVITRVGSGYGARMRSDELPARLILDVLHGRDIPLRSPYAKRLWTYGKDIIEFYSKLVDNLNQYIGLTLHCAGNANNEIVTNMSLAKLVASYGKNNVVITEDSYEAGEIIDGKPISFEIDTDDESLVIWDPKFTLDDGMKATFEWFEHNLQRYSGTIHNNS